MSVRQMTGLPAESGMVVTIRYDATGDTETFLLGRRFAKETNLPVYSMLSPLGHAIVGARPGEQRIYTRPQESRPVFVTVLSAVPFQKHTASKELA
ncbi:GreA/GreB family elongation factor [Mycobacterium asiaticum]|uniref:GreA/GreB family elongation factor n=1 Tax=Mycobacterium asiaticum TaxID=1790 RepID=UPI000AC5338B